jgi:hypothetical protein
MFASTFPAVDCEDWLDDHILIGEQIARKLGLSVAGTRPQRLIALDALADELGFDTSRLRCPAYEVLDDLMRRLGDLMDRGRGRGRSLINDFDSGEVSGIVDEVAKAPYLEEVVSAMIQFGRGSQEIDGRSVNYRDLENVAREGLAKTLKQRVVSTLTKWYSTGVGTTRHSHRRERV